jgi:hypothetical protein
VDNPWKSPGRRLQKTVAAPKATPNMPRLNATLTPVSDCPATTSLRNLMLLHNLTQIEGIANVRIGRKSQKLPENRTILAGPIAPTPENSIQCG